MKRIKGQQYLLNSTTGTIQNRIRIVQYNKEVNTSNGDSTAKRTDQQGG